ncbi:hypothetical protein GOP47_0017284 [Adiantum capillus-veneris]|uniref:Large ribosomal subunit protein uL5c n=1 Tax=Adiantum capillus-veneris TaxID=13818 RepID=A0A9D4UF16_ADICA|nr:hypothetical protein GOP47_0017284 [Adiantum capillus-veneris]
MALAAGRVAMVSEASSLAASSSYSSRDSMPASISSFTLVRVSRNAMCVRSSSAAVAEAPASAVEMPRLKSIYVNKVVPALKEEFQYTNLLQIPRVEKVVINCGIGEASQNAKILEAGIKDISTVTGQRPNITRAKKAIAGFKIRQGVPVGVAVTLRGELMYSFLDRLLNLVLPRTRDFLGVSPYSFDGKGNYNLGLKEQGVFPEIKFDNIDKPRGMDISIVTSARTDKEGQKLLTLLGMPFRAGDVSAKPVVIKKKGNFNIKGGKGKAKKPVTKSKKKK